MPAAKTKAVSTPKGSARGQAKLSFPSKKASPVAPSKPAKAAAEKSTAQAHAEVCAEAPRPPALDKHSEDVLRKFDLNPSFGPCQSMKRLDRWKRASKLGKNPPDEVFEILNRLKPHYEESILHGRV
jgi:DNA polymerase delta subunit 4